jgi:hypothetical protein
MHPGLTASDILAFRLSKVRHVCALSTLNYSRNVPQIATSVPNLFVVTSAQIVNGTLNVNETVKLANAAMEDLEYNNAQHGETHASARQAGRESLAGPR